MLIFKSSILNFRELILVIFFEELSKNWGDLNQSNSQTSHSIQLNAATKIIHASYKRTINS